MESTSVKLFISYSHRDEALRQHLDKHLASLKRQKVIDSWHDRKLEAGMEWANKIDENLNQADIILLLISPDFIYSNYCSEIEMEQAIKQHDAGEAIIVPIILEPCDWKWLAVSKYQAFPKDAKPITTWNNENEAFLDVIQGIRLVAERLFEQRQQKFKEKKAAQDQYLKKVEEILSSNGEISIPAQDTLDELREELKLTSEEAEELQNRAFEPYKKYKEHLQKYEKTFLKVIQKEYPVSDKTKADLKLRQRDLGIKHEDSEQIEQWILAQVTVESREQVKAEESQIHPQPEAFLNSSENPSQLQPKTVISAAISAAIDPIFLERCQRELARYIGPMAQFIMADILAEHSQIERPQLVELLSGEITNPEKAKEFKQNLL
ncbi:MAG: toll/interleukin-1 receptor domain-containing protein [Microcystis aeruginosa Ma_OC_H_19870700_S124]|uniref:Toll/interleukin-1 receptor domain-containing protein n=1 Tax=Microcystis aeruginosa Ma_OC_H_19870700_S124 TaxID=2486262 RepID=A0A552AB85_MICAE|nr:toll/interleukin-1 receptor domain-containing protein [Burkholderiales bacterium]TRT82736.1 MAG: toll/interleukin-1 receptor domain-containing protein [Microcystis aeruginosa Ma_OC_H_19870700_S124]